MLRCFDGNEHKGRLQEIYRSDRCSPLGEYEVVKWCSNCGAVVIDLEIDGRIFPGRIKPMCFPKFKQSNEEIMKEEDIVSQLDEFTQAYIEAALWASNLDVEHGPTDIAPETFEIMIADCKRFQEENVEDIVSSEGSARKMCFEHAGYDFWLTRNRHGAGFWDGGWSEKVEERLTIAAKAYKPIDFYIGNDKLIHSN